MTRPEIIAHRGASRDAAENTLRAFRRAVELGADACELDVHRTADGVIVVHHDPMLADGTPIASLTAAEVTTHTVRGEPIPTLAAVFQVVGRDLRIYCELKGLGTAEGTLAVIARHPLPTPLPFDAARGLDLGAAAVHAFDHRQVQVAAQRSPEIARGVLEVSYPIDPTAAARSVEARDCWRHAEFIDEAFVRAVHAEGRRVIAWTVNSAPAMRRLADWGVDALCTDDVALARSLFRG
ncbi:MAG: glycerophosphodiester phosphodiesterase [Gemmatimonadaceae bacterium]